MAQLSLGDFARQARGKAPAPPPVPEPAAAAGQVTMHHDQQQLIALATEMEEHCAVEIDFVRRVIAGAYAAVSHEWTADEAEICLRGEMP